LFVVPPWTGHVNPTVSIARALVDGGHEVAWAGYGVVIGRLLPEGARLFELGDGVPAAFAPRPPDAPELRHLESLKFLWEALLVPLAGAMRAPVEEVIAAYRPDVVVVDHQAIGGALAARRAGVPWASLCTTSASVVDSLGGLPKVKAWVDEQLRALELAAGLPAAAAPDLSPARVIVLSTPALIGEVALPAHYRLVGPALLARPDATPFPWDALDPERRRVFVSFGTVSVDRGGRFYDHVVDGLGHGPWQLILVAPPGRVAAPPGSDAIVVPRVPQLALLPHVHAVVCHAGHNTVCESLAARLPLVVAPIRDDQPVIADQVARAGAGLRLHFGRLSPTGLVTAVGRVLDEPAFGAAAARIAASFAAAGGAIEAARLIVELDAPEVGR
jgi:MGT family glycosyltransferase